MQKTEEVFKDFDKTRAQYDSSALGYKFPDAKKANQMSKQNHTAIAEKAWEEVKEVIMENIHRGATSAKLSTVSNIHMDHVLKYVREELKERGYRIETGRRPVVHWG